jgi:hypothetical protein
MTVGFSLFLIAAGAILRWGIDAVVEGANLDVIGLILIVIGAVGLLIGLFTGGTFTRSTTRERVERGPRGEERITEHRRV